MLEQRYSEARPEALWQQEVQLVPVDFRLCDLRLRPLQRNLYLQALEAGRMLL